MLREVGRLTKQLKRVPSSGPYQEQLNGLTAELNRHRGAISNPDVGRADLEDFYQAELWQDIDRIRTIAQFPNEYRNLNQTLRRLTNTTKAKLLQKLGLNMERVRQEAAEKTQALNNAKTAFDRGDIEETKAIMEENFYQEGQHPGNTESLIQEIRNISNMMRSIRDANVKQQIKAALDEVIAAFNEGDWQGAREILDDKKQELDSLIRSSLRPRR